MSEQVREPAATDAATPSRSDEAVRRLHRTQAELEVQRGGQRVDMSDVTTRLKRIVRRNPRLTNAALRGFKQLQRYDAWTQERAARRWQRRNRFDQAVLNPGLSPLATEYRSLIGELQVVDPTTTRNLAFCVSSCDPSSGRGDLYVAAGLARALRRLGWRTSMYGPSGWDLIPDGMNVVVAMVPKVDPQFLPPTALRVAWSRSFLDQWLAPEHACDWDLWLAVSDVMAAQLRDRVNAPVGVLPIAVDEELFVAPEDGARRSLVVSTTNDFGGGRQLLQFLAEMGPPKSMVLYGNRRRRSRRSRALRRCEAGPIDYFAIPSVYGSAAVVLDDQLPGARAVGSLNSRIYESLAAGALPITNSQLALEGVGLEGVPVYHDPTSLRTAIAAHQSFGAETAALVDRLRRDVLNRHTFRHRADTFTRIIEDAGTAHLTARRAVTFGFFPDYREENPYQTLLYSGARHLGVSLQAMENPIWEDPNDMRGSTRIWNFQWEHTLFAGIDSEAEADLRVSNLMDRLRVFRAAGGVVVWTLHNREPHENRLPIAERRLQFALAETADRVHILCARTAIEVPALAHVEPDRLLTVPHCSFVGWYADAVSQDAARRELGLDPDKPIIGLIGGIRAYKGIDRVIAALDVPAVAATGLEVVVAGKPAAGPDSAALRKLIVDHPRVHSHLAFVSNERLQLYFKAPDVIVLPYRKTLNSSVLLAALTFGRPVIAPINGCLADVLDHRFSIGFDIDDEDGLVHALANVERLRTPQARRAARDYAESYCSDAMSRQFFEGILGQRAVADEGAAAK